MDLKWSPDPPRSGGPRWPSLIGLVGSYGIFFDSTIFGCFWLLLDLFDYFLLLCWANFGYYFAIYIVLFAILGILNIIYA